MTYFFKFCWTVLVDRKFSNNLTKKIVWSWKIWFISGKPKLVFIISILWKNPTRNKKRGNLHIVRISLYIFILAYWNLCSIALKLDHFYLYFDFFGCIFSNLKLNTNFYTFVERGKNWKFFKIWGKRDERFFFSFLPQLLFIYIDLSDFCFVVEMTESEFF